MRLINYVSDWVIENCPDLETPICFTPDKIKANTYKIHITHEYILSKFIFEYYILQHILMNPYNL